MIFMNPIMIPRIDPFTVISQRTNISLSYQEKSFSRIIILAFFFDFYFSPKPENLKAVKFVC